MPKYSDWVIENAVFYLQLRLKSSEYKVNFESFVYDTSVRECHTLTITVDNSHKDLPKFMQVNIAFPADPEYPLTIEKEIIKQTKKFPGAVKLIIRRDYRLAKLIDYTHAFICEYLNSPNYLSYLSSPDYVQPWKIHWPNKDKDNAEPVLICEAKQTPSNDNNGSQEKFIHDIKIAQENMWAIITHQEPPDISMPFRLSKTGCLLIKGNFPIDNIILKLETFSLQLLHEEYLALLNKQNVVPSHKRPKSTQSVVTPAVTANKWVDNKLSLAANSDDDQQLSSNATTKPPELSISKPAAASSLPKLYLFYECSDDEDSDDDASKKVKKSKIEEVKKDEIVSDSSATAGFRKK